jgi:hypothetical protein
VERDVVAAVHHEVLANAACRHREPDRRDVVVVEPGSLAGHPREHPGVHAVVLVDELVAPAIRVRVDERLPDVGPFDDPLRDDLKLVGGQQPLVRNEITE